MMKVMMLMIYVWSSICLQGACSRYIRVIYAIKSLATNMLKQLWFQFYTKHTYQVYSARICIMRHIGKASTQHSRLKTHKSI
ncbi:unnamed protein product [Blepharisma stoltei]|uniref:Secreted protein n=1 Tax=Blepharisma stoltei TaxID=1481888 RepID=A0AAU9IMA9_9CILI|nr:unnamed protein product [Blepharisma stoltei]